MQENVKSLANCDLWNRIDVAFTRSKVPIQLQFVFSQSNPSENTKSTDSIRIRPSSLGTKTPPRIIINRRIKYTSTFRSG